MRQSSRKVLLRLRPRAIVRDVRNVLRDDGILVLDVGAHHNWFVQLWEARRPQSMLNAFGFGAMGFGTSGALGAKLAAPERQCVAVVGDGSFMMTPHVVATAVEYNIAVVWVVWNNFGWTSIRDIQLGMFQGRELGTLFYKDGERYNPDFAMMARAAGCDGITVTHNKDFAGALEHALGLGKPCLIDAHVDGDIRPVPTGGVPSILRCPRRRRPTGSDSSPSPWRESSRAAGMRRYMRSPPSYSMGR